MKKRSREERASATKKDRIYYIRYRDHVLFRNTQHDRHHPCVRETCGWIVGETTEAVCILWDRDVKHIPHQKPLLQESGLVILKGDIMEMKKLEISSD